MNNQANLNFWKLGFIDGSRSKNLHKASFIVESYQKKASLDEIYSNVINENPRVAIKKAKTKVLIIAYVSKKGSKSI